MRSALLLITMHKHISKFTDARHTYQYIRAPLKSHMHACTTHTHAFTTHTHMLIYQHTQSAGFTHAGLSNWSATPVNTYSTYLHYSKAIGPWPRCYMTFSNLLYHLSPQHTADTESTPSMICSHCRFIHFHWQRSLVSQYTKHIRTHHPTYLQHNSPVPTHVLGVGGENPVNRSQTLLDNNTVLTIAVRTWTIHEKCTALECCN